MSPTASPPRFFFDYVDPASFLIEQHLTALDDEVPVGVDRVPFELCPPPQDLIDPAAAPWRARWQEARAEVVAGGISLAAPRFVPWTRKAHEFALLAREQQRFDPVHRALFKAFHLEGRDLGRVDVLLQIAVHHGMDLTHTKVVLDADRYTLAVEQTRAEAERLGIPGVPALLAGHRWLVGLQDSETLLKFLHDQKQG